MAGYHGSHCSVRRYVAAPAHDDCKIENTAGLEHRPVAGPATTHTHTH